MAAIIVYAKVAGNWDAANAWNDAANGTGTDYTNPQNGANTFTCNLNALAMTLNVDATVTLVTAASGSLTVSGTRVLTSAVTYSGTATTGMVIIPTGTSLTINGLVTTSGSGAYAIVSAGTGSLTINNVGATALTSSSSYGFGIYWNSTGALAINGDVASTAALAGIARVNAAATVTITGNIATVYQGLNGAVFIVAGTTTLDGTFSGSGCAVGVYGGTFVWSTASSRTLAASQTIVITTTYSGTVTLTNVLLANSGHFCIWNAGGTINKSGFVITNQTANAQAVGVNTDITANVTGPTLPAAADVQSGAADYGYAGGLLDPSYATTAATNAAHQAADLAFLNTNKDEMIPANASIRAQYGCDVGTAAAGYTYGDEAQAKVLTTATGAGTYQPVAVGDVQDGVAVGVSPAVGTFTSPAVGKVLSDTSWGAGGTEFTGTYHPTLVVEVLSTVTFGASSAETGTYVVPVVGQVLAPAQGGTAYGPSSGTSGTLTFANTQYVLSTTADYGIAGTGGAKTATIPTASNVLTGSGAYGVNGSGSTPSYSPDFPAVGSVLTTDTVDGSAGTYVAPVQAGYSALAAGYGAAGGTTGTLAASKIRDATYGTLGDGSVLVAAGGTYVDPADSGVWYSVAVGVSPRAGTKRASSVANCSAGNVKLDVVIDDVTGTYGGGGGGSPLLINGGLISTR